MGYKKKTVPKTTSNITKGIINFLNAEGHIAVRIHTTGIYDERKKQYIRSGSTKGVLDIACTLFPSGRHLVVDVKNDGDTLSDEQIEYIAQVQRCGGIALDAADVDSFMQYYFEHIKPLL